MPCNNFEPAAPGPVWAGSKCKNCEGKKKEHGEAAKPTASATVAPSSASKTSVAPSAPAAPPMAPGAPPMAPGAPPMAPGAPPMAPSAPLFNVPKASGYSGAAKPKQKAEEVDLDALLASLETPAKTTAPATTKPVASKSAIDLELDALLADLDAQLGALAAPTGVPTGSVSKAPEGKKPDGSEKERVYRGDLDALPTNPASNRTVRVFVSSTFTDTAVERNLLIAKVYPRLRDAALRYGLEFIPSEMRWGIREEASNSHQTADICMAELDRCMRSPAIDYVLLLGDKYGFRPFPCNILEEEFKTLRKHAAAPVQALMDEWFKLDTNAVPPVYRLRPSSEAPEGQWWGGKKIFENLQLGLREASKHLSPQRAAVYTISVTHDEIEHGALNRHVAKDHPYLVFFRTVTGTVDKADGARKNYFDFDADAPDALSKLRTQLRKEIPADCVFEKTIPWGEAKGIIEPAADWDPSTEAKNGGQHAEWLKFFCRTFEDRLLKSITTAGQKLQHVLSDSHYLELMGHNVFGYTKALMVQGRESLIKDISTCISKHSVCVIHGFSGCGKTSVLAALARQTGSVEQKWVILRFLGTSANSCDVRSLLRDLCKHLAVLFPAYINDDKAAINPEKESNIGLLAKEWHRRLGWAKKAGRDVYIFLDSLDQLSDVTAGIDWLPLPPPPNVRLVVSTLPDVGGYLSALRLKVKPESIIEVPLLPAQVRSTILDTWLKQDHRSLTAAQKTAVLNAANTSPSPLFLRLAHSVARKWTSFAPAVGPDELPLANSVAGLIQQIFIGLERQHGSILVAHAFAYFSVAPKGVSAGEMEDLLSLDDRVLEDVYQWWRPPVRRIPPLLWTRLWSDVQEFIVTKGSLGMQVYHWFHRQFWQEAEARYLQDKSFVSYIHSNLGDLYSGKYIKGKPAPAGGAPVDRMLTNALGELGPRLQARLKGETPSVTPWLGDLDPAGAHYLGSVLTHLGASRRFDEAMALATSLEWLVAATKALGFAGLRDEIGTLLARMQDADVDTKEVQLLSEALALCSSAVVERPIQLLLELPARLRPGVTASTKNLKGLIAEADKMKLKEPYWPVAIVPNFVGVGGALRASLQHSPSGLVRSVCGPGVSVWPGQSAESDASNLLVSAGENITKVWRLDNFQPIRELNTPSVMQACISEDGKHVFVTCDDYTTGKSVAQWSVETGAELKKWKPPASIPAHAQKGTSTTTIQLRGNRFVWLFARYVLEYEISSSEPRTYATTPDFDTSKALYGPSGTNWLAVGCRNNTPGAASTTIVIYDLSQPNKDAKPIQTINVPFSAVLQLGLAGPSTVVATGMSKQFWTFDVKTGQKVMEFKDHTTMCLWCDGDPTSGQILSSAMDNAVKLWDAKTGAVKCSLSELGVGCKPRALAFMPTGLLAVGTDVGLVQIWAPSVWEAEEKKDVLQHTQQVAVSLASHGKRGISRAEKKMFDLAAANMLLWDDTTTKPHPIHNLPAASHAVISPDGKMVVLHQKGTISVYQFDVLAKGGAAQSTITLKDVERIFLLGTTRLALIVKGGSFGVWDIASGNEDVALRSNQQLVSESLWVSEDGKTVSACSRKDACLVWALETPGTILFTQNLSNSRHSVTSANGNSIVFMSLVGDLVCCRRSGGGVVTKTNEFSHGSYRNSTITRRVAAICLSPDGTILFTGDEYGAVVLWRGCFGEGAPSSTVIYQAGKEIFSLSTQADGSSSVLAVGCSDGQIIMMRAA